MKAIALAVCFSAYLYATDKVQSPPDRPVLAFVNVVVWVIALRAVWPRGAR